MTELNPDVVLDAVCDNRVMTLDEVAATFDAVVLDAWAELNDRHWKTYFDDDLICFERTRLGKVIDFVNHRVRGQVS